MHLIDWSGPIFGPGSEWFWAFAQFIAVVVTLFGIYRQLRSQGATNAMQRIETVQGRWDSPRMAYARLEFALYMRYQDRAAVPFTTYMPILDFWMDLALLVDEGYISIREVAGNYGLTMQIWSALAAPAVEALRTANHRPELYREVDDLVTRIRAEDRRSDSPPVNLVESTIRRSLDFAIAANTTRLRQETAWQSGDIPSAPTPEVAS